MTASQKRLIRSRPAPTCPRAGEPASVHEPSELRFEAKAKLDRLDRMKVNFVGRWRTGSGRVLRLVVVVDIVIVAVEQVEDIAGDPPVWLIR